MAESLASKGALREGLSVDVAIDIIWLLNHPSVYYLAVTENSWPEEGFEPWLAGAFIRQLLT